jgi:hypothetical protein
VGPDNSVRFIETFVGGLDLQAAGFARVVSLKWLGPLHPIMVVSSKKKRNDRFGKLENAKLMSGIRRLAAL